MPPLEPAAPIIVNGEGHISAAVVDQATEWLAILWSGMATPEDHQACARWREAHVDHERAWQRLQALEQKFQIVPPTIAKKTLQRPGARGRRRILKALGGMLITGAAIQGVRQTSAWQRYAADHRTAVGERRSITLADSTEVALNTSSAIDVDFDARQRHLRLRTGEMLVSTAPDRRIPPRPFTVATAHGTVRALGTRFTVRQIDDDASQVAVLEGAVILEPSVEPGRALRLSAGQQASFTEAAVQPSGGIDENSRAWIDGALVAERMRLDAFLRELGRYRPGLLRCDPAVGHLLLTGGYVLPDTDRILASIARALPVKVIYRSRYWVSVTAR